MRRPNWYDYDPTLQMIREPLREPDHKHLEALRWAVWNGKYDGDLRSSYPLVTVAMLLAAG